MKEMKTYTGTKTLKARPMSRGEYNDYQGWTIPEDENPEDPGYLVEYLDGGKPNHHNHAGYVSWSPQDVFERAYNETTNADSMLVDIGSQRFTQIFATDEPGFGGGYHKYQVFTAGDFPFQVASVNLQNGPVIEAGVNGCHHEDLIAIVLHRLQCFQAGGFKCRENALAFTKLEEALHWLGHRTKDRQDRGVEGTSAQ